ncbi:MAG TPA: DUF433 domain-containing protein [Pyrinomonadaceae bacterium]|nr:DUF433 domain-containing protein [Pyrinomonadaceae bacterium]
MSQTTATVPLAMNEAGVLRITGTRVSLDSVLYSFNEGSTPEEIVYQFQTLNLADVYAVIAYYLQNRAEIDDYLEKREAERDELQKELEARFPQHGIRERLLARKK